MRKEQRDQLAAIVAKRSRLRTPIERMIFDNDPTNGPVGLRIIAMGEAKSKATA